MSNTTSPIRRAVLVLALGALVGCGNPAPDLCNPTSKDAMLPNSRNTTYTPASPVKSADLNDFQDCIIGMKHPELELPLHPGGFRNEGSGGAAAFQGHEWNNAGAGAFTVYHELRLPVGERITRYKVGYKRTNAGAIAVALVRSKLDGSLIGGGVEEQIDGFTDNAGNINTNGDTVQERDNINHTIADGYVYALWIGVDATADAAGAAVRGGVAFYDRL